MSNDYYPDYEFDDLDIDEHRPEPASLDEALTALRAETEADVLPSAVVYRLSDLEGDDLAAFKATWVELPVEKRRRIINFLGELAEINYDLNFDSLAMVAFEDSDAEVRATAIDLTWYDVSEPTFHTLMKLADDDVSLVRAAAMSALGRFIYHAELEEFNQALSEKAQDLALSRYQDVNEDVDVRRRSLEAFAHSSHPHVADMIEESYQGDEPMLRVSAVFAMGASCDNQWENMVRDELESDMSEMQFEAVRAAGELRLSQAVPRLIELAQFDDYEIQIMAIWSLGEIGTNEARRGLENLAEAFDEAGEDDETLIVAVEEALEMASLVTGMSLTMFDFDDDDDIMSELFDVYDPDDPSLLN